METNIQTIKVIFDSRLEPNVPVIFPTDGSELDVKNNTSLLLDLYSIFYDSSDNFLYPFKIIRVVVDWGDGNTSEYNYKINPTGINWLSDINNWLMNIGPHYYEVNVENNISDHINVKVYDSIDNLYEINIKRKIGIQNIFDIGLEMEVVKAAFSNNYSTVLLKTNNINNNPIYNTNIPLISVLK